MSSAKTAVIVVGMHRSGTSAVSSVFSTLGFSHGNSVIPAADDNEFGFWESRRIINLNQHMLNAIGARWDAFPTHVKPFSDKPADHIDWLRHTFAHEVTRVLKNEFGDEPRIVIKDPRMCLLLPLWIEGAQQAGYDVKCLYVHRTPEAVARSLFARNGFDLAKSQELWLRYSYWALSTLPDQTPTIAYTDFLEDPLACLTKAGFDVDEKQQNEIRKQVVKPSHTSFFPPSYRTGAMKRIPKFIETHPTLPDMEAREEWLSPAGHNLRVADLMAGRTFALGPPHKSKPAATSGVRPVVFHCHLFKNAGTSVDHILKTNFEDAWTEQEFPSNSHVSNAELVRSHIIANTKMKAFSSHTGNWHLHQDLGKTEVYPIIFLRHPLLRVESAYKFERKQEADTVGAKLAKRANFKEYVSERLSQETDLAFENYQARRLAFFSTRTILDLERQAWNAFEQQPFIGCVERFDASLTAMESYLKSAFPGFVTFATRQNVTDREAVSDEVKLQKIADELGGPLMQKFMDANAIDFAIYNALVARYDQHGG